MNPSEMRFAVHAALEHNPLLHTFVLGTRNLLAFPMGAEMDLNMVPCFVDRTEVVEVAVPETEDALSFRTGPGTGGGAGSEGAGFQGRGGSFLRHRASNALPVRIRCSSLASSSSCVISAQMGSAASRRSFS